MATFKYNFSLFQPQSKPSKWVNITSLSNFGNLDKFKPDKNDLKIVIKSESKIELAKIALCKREDFNIFEVYKMYFDRDSKGYVTLDDFKYAFTEFEMQENSISSKSIGLIYSRYVNQNTGGLINKQPVMQYWDFTEMILPKDRTYRAMAINRMPVYINYCSQNNDEGKRKCQELKGYTHSKLKEMMKEMFEVMVQNLKKIEDGVNRYSFDDTTWKALTEVDTNY